MKCPHCQVEIHDNFRSTIATQDNFVGEENDERTMWYVRSMQCPACRKALLELVKQHGEKRETWSIYPQFSTRPPAPPAVPKAIAEDFNEAAAVLPISPKASAALSRRCLEGLLHANNFKGTNLVKSIELAINSKNIPESLSSNLHYLRQIGNFAAHTNKDIRADTVLPVEPEEAEWGLEVLEGLFDHYYVQPEKNLARKKAWDAKHKKPENQSSKKPDEAQ